MKNVLIACEESQAVTIAFRNIGCNAFSCDLQPCSGGYPEWHIQADVLPLLNGSCSFTTQDGLLHTIEKKWDLIIAHPPCTYLSNVAAARLYPKAGCIDIIRYQKGMQARSFFMSIYNADCDCICIENPLPSRCFNLPIHSDTVNWFNFGFPYTKRTLLWLKGLPPLFSTSILVGDLKSWVYSNNSSKMRSKTCPGIASAMAEQWINYI